MHPTFIQIPFSFLTHFSWVYFAVAQKNQIITFGSFSFRSTPFFSLDFNISCFSFLFENAAHRPQTDAHTLSNFSLRYCGVVT